MMLDRRQLLRHALVFSASASLGGGVFQRRAAAVSCGELVVVVQQASGVVAVDPGTSAIGPSNGPLLATPIADDPQTTPVSIPESLEAVVTEGSIGYWMTSPDGVAHVFRVDTGVASSWWWRRDGERSKRLRLPGDLEPALPSGTVAGWFHGASIDAAHLGSGTLRLFAADIRSGEIVLEHDLDRRLELAATSVTDDGAVVAHVQAGNTGTEVWAMDLRRGGPPLQMMTTFESAPVAASAIDLRVATDGDLMIIAVGLTWAWPDHPDPMVLIVSSDGPGNARAISLDGELVGIVSAVS